MSAPAPTPAGQDLSAPAAAPLPQTRADFQDTKQALFAQVLGAGASTRGLQDSLMKNPEAGDVIEGTGGLRKVRHADPRRGKGKRGGLRVIYYWWDGKNQFWLFTLYDKHELDDLSSKQKAALKTMLKAELEARQ